MIFEKFYLEQFHSRPLICKMKAFTNSSKVMANIKVFVDPTDKAKTISPKSTDTGA